MSVRELNQDLCLCNSHLLLRRGYLLFSLYSLIWAAFYQIISLFECSTYHSTGKNIFTPLCNEAFTLINATRWAHTELLGATVCYRNRQRLSMQSFSPMWFTIIPKQHIKLEPLLLDDTDLFCFPSHTQLQVLHALGKNCARLRTTPSQSTGHLMMNSQWCPTSSSTPSSPDSPTLPVSYR